MERSTVVLAEVSSARRDLCTRSHGLALVSRHRSFPWGISHIFLILNVLVRHS